MYDNKNSLLDSSVLVLKYEKLSSNTLKKGTGLGLAIVRKIFEEHGGSIELLDAPAQSDQEPVGAMVRLILPVTAAELDTQEKEEK